MQDTMLSQNIIITERCRSLRQLGRNALAGKWSNAILAVIIYMVCVSVPVLVFDNLFGMNLGNIITQEGLTYGMDPETYMNLSNSIPQTSILSSIYVLLISGALELGLMIYFLASFRGHNVMPKDIFLGFERFGKALGLFLFQGLFIFLWCLLFIVPGIIAAIRYSQAFFVLADDPDKSIRQCMDESKSMMRGNKAKYFLLSLSFIGWAFLSAIPGGILQAIAETMTTNVVVISIASLIGNLILAPIYAYIYSTYAGFYEILAGHLIKETEPAPIEVDQITTIAPLSQIEEVIEDVEAKEAEAEADLQEELMEPEDLPEADILPPPLDEEDEYHD